MAKEPRQPDPVAEAVAAAGIDLDAIGALAFEPWERTHTDPLLSVDRWVSGFNPHAITINLAHALCHKTKEELVASLREPAAHIVPDLLGRIASTGDMLEAWLDVLYAAQARLIVAAAATGRAEQ